MDDPDVKLLILIVFAAALAGAVWFYRDDILPASDEPVAAQYEPIDQDHAIKSAPLHPIEPPLSTESFDGELLALPPLDDSDSYFLLALIDVFGNDVGNVLVNEGLIDKFVATVDNLTRSHVPEKIRPVGGLSGAFGLDAAESNGQVQLNPENYKRYDLLVNLVAGADLNVIASTYRRFYPLFQESYVRLGYPNGYFNDRVIEVIDHLLATPEPTGPIHLVRPLVLYKFADANLEALSSGQKLLIRMGNRHAESIKIVLQGLRGMIAKAPRDLQ